MAIAPAKFPAAKWDGSSASRTTTLDNEPIQQIDRGPNADDWKQITSEVIAIENQLGSPSLAAAATTGFFYIPAISGTVSGTPAAVPTGFIALAYNTTDHKLYAYDGGWVKTAALA